MPPARIRVFRGRDSHEWVALHAGDCRGRDTWEQAYTVADRAASARRRLRALSVARMDLLRRLSEAHRPVYEPYVTWVGEKVSGVHQARCPVCDGGRWRVRLDEGEPYACRAWWDAVAARVVDP